jgi:hypothetical protein
MANAIDTVIIPQTYPCSSLAEIRWEFDWLAGTSLRSEDVESDSVYID